MANFFEIKHQTNDMMSKAIQMSEKFGYDTVAESIKEIRDTFNNKELMVVAAGEARRGKSTLLNALLNEKTPLFPMDINVCTNVVTIVRYGKTEKIEAYIEVPDKKEPIIESISREQIEDYVSEKGNPNNYKNVTLLNIAIPNDLLKEGVVFVDTPGVGSLNIAHAEATYAFLPNADILLFVSDTNSGFTETELNFLKRGYQYCKNVIFPLTKKDLNANYSVIIEDNKRKIENTLNIPAEDIKIIPVSSMAKLRYLERGSKAMYINSNFQELENTIWNTIANKRANILLLPYIVQIRQELQKIVDSIATQYQLLNTDQNKSKELIAALNKEKINMENFQMDSAQWRNKLNYFTTTLSSQTNLKIQNIGANARSNFESNSANLGVEICKESVYTELISNINDIFTCGLLDIRDDISNQVDEEINNVRKELKLDIDINLSALDEIDFVPNDKLQVEFPKHKLTDRLFSSGRKISSNTIAAKTMGGILGGIAGFCLMGPGGIAAGYIVGQAIGEIAGTTKGCVDSIKKHDERDVAIVNKAIAQHISTNIANMNATLSTTIAQLRMNLTSEFELMLKKRIKEIQENMANIQNNINLSQKDVPNKLASLKNQNDVIKSYIQASDNLMEKIRRFQEIKKPFIDHKDEPTYENTKDDIKQEKLNNTLSTDELEYDFL